MISQERIDKTKDKHLRKLADCRNKLISVRKLIKSTFDLDEINRLETSRDKFAKGVDRHRYYANNPQKDIEQRIKRSKKPAVKKRTYERIRRWAKKNPKKTAEYSRAAYKKNPARYHATTTKCRRIRKHGSLENYEKSLEDKLVASALRKKLKEKRTLNFKKRVSFTKEYYRAKRAFPYMSRLLFTNMSEGLRSVVTLCAEGVEALDEIRGDPNQIDILEERKANTEAVRVYRSDPEVRSRIRAWDKEWRRKNPEKAKAIEERYHLKKRTNERSQNGKNSTGTNQGKLSK